MEHRIVKYFLLPAASALLLCGCMKRTIEPEKKKDGYLEISLVWAGGDKPQAARFLIYGPDGKLVKETSEVTSVFKGSLPEGRYRIAVHNTDARQVDYRGIDRFETAEVFAKQTHYTDRSGFSTTRHDTGVPCILEPQWVFGTGGCREYSELAVTSGDTVRATVTPTLLTKQMEFHFSVKSEEAVKSLSGIMGGVSPGIFLSTGKHNTASSCAVEFTAAPATKAGDGEYTALLGVFNLMVTPDCPPGTCPVNVHLTLENGDRLEATFDMTSTLQDIIGDNGGAIPVEIPVEVTLETKGIDGLSATVRPWDENGSGSGHPRPQPVPVRKTTRKNIK